MTKSEFKYNRYFTKNEINMYPKGWLYHHEMSHAEKKLQPDLIKQLIFINPDVWGSKELNSLYWRNNDYHPSLYDFDAKTMKNEVLLIGKIIKQKKNVKGTYETVLMSNSRNQINDFTEDQCKNMLQCNLKVKKSILVRRKSQQSITNCDVKKESDTSSKTGNELDENIANKNQDVSIDEFFENCSMDSDIKLLKEASTKDSESYTLSNDDNKVFLDDKKSKISTKSKVLKRNEKKPIENQVNVEKHYRNNQIIKRHQKSRVPKRMKKEIYSNEVSNDITDFLLYKEVAFDMKDDVFKSRFNREMNKATLPDKLLKNGRYLIGYVCERVNKKARAGQHPAYKIGFQYAGDGMKEMIFTMEEIFHANQLYIKVSNQKITPSKDYPETDLFKCEHSGFESLYQFNPDDVDGDVIESDDDDDEDLMNQKMPRLEEKNSYFQEQCHGAGSNSQFNTDLFMEYPPDTNSNHLDNNHGLVWEKNVQIDRPSGIRPHTRSRLIPEFRNKFRSEIESFLAFLPVKFWLYHLKQTNDYMKGSMERKSGDETDSSSLSQYREIRFDELMTFYAIIIQMAMKPNPGSRYTDCWKNDHKVWYTACNHMSKNRFQEIRAALHWCDNRLKNLGVNQEAKKQDTLYKIRPLLSIIETNLGRYLDPCTELSLDETCVAIRSQWARALTFYNPKKPKGKHHLKFYTLCENSHWCALQIKMCHRFKKDNFEVKDSELEPKEKGFKKKSTRDILSDNSFNENEVIGSDVEDADYYHDSADNESITMLNKNTLNESLDEVGEIIDEEISNLSLNDNDTSKKEKSQCENIAQKTVQTVTSLCKIYEGSGRIVNMDNLYSSPLVFIKLKEMSLYARGTVRLNRKYLPRFIKYLKKDMAKLPRGSYQFAVNNEYKMSMHCWHDKNPVHVLSTADSTTVEEVSRKQGSSKIIVQCPSTIKNYNKNMQAVDQFNKLMSLFSLSEAHTFTKYYKKIAMVLMDFVLVNSYLHYKLFVDSSVSVESKKKKKITRKKYMENLIEALIHTDWAKAARDDEKKVEQNAGIKKRKYGYMSGETNNNEGDDHMFNEIDFDPVPSLPPLPNEYICQAVSFDSKTSFFSAKNGAKNKSKFYCKICQFEGRGNVRKGTVFCCNHGLSLCQQVHFHPKEKETFILRNSKIKTKDIHDWEWLSPRQDEWTCWEKAHYHYIPKGLFNLKERSIRINDFTKYAAFDFGSSPYLLRKIAFKNTYYKKVGVRTEKKLANEMLQK